MQKTGFVYTITLGIFWETVYSLAIIAIGAGAVCLINILL
jgi:hypothetical protein